MTVIVQAFSELTVSMTGVVYKFVNHYEQNVRHIS